MTNSTTSFLAMVLATGCGASSKDPDPSLCETSAWHVDLADDSGSIDLVGTAAAEPDGTEDLVFETSIAGPIDALVLVTAEASGETCCGQQWDTLAGDAPIPATIGSIYAQGSETWVLGVESGGALISDDDGSISAIDGECTTLRLVAGPPPVSLEGLHFRVHVVRPDGEVEASPLVAYEAVADPEGAR